MSVYVSMLLLMGGVLLTLGDLVFKYYAGHHSASLYALGFLFYMGGLVPLIESYKYANIEVASALLVLFNITILAIAGWLFFKEHIGVYEILGLVAAGVAIVLLEIGG
jgi:multidrug transporter EmrE-like cation transporter